MAKLDKSKNEEKNKKHFWKDFKAELKKVIWPTPKQIANNTVAVITIVLITAVIVFLLDLTFDALNTYGINKLQGIVESINPDESNVSNEVEQSNEAGNVDNEISNETVSNEAE